MSDRDYESMIVPGVSGYYHIPPVWIGSPPSESEFPDSALDELIRDEYSCTLHHGIRVRVRRDGLFIFDCTKWEPAGVTEIPAHSIKTGERIPRAVSDAEDAAELRAAMRAQLMNAHQACLSSAHNAVHRRATGLGAMILPSRMIRLLEFESNEIGVLNPHDPYERHVSQLLTFTQAYRARDLRARHVVELDTVEYSLRLLDVLLKSSVPGLLHLVELLYRAGVQYSESRFAESLVLSWTVCERLIDLMWTRYIEGRRGPSGAPRRVNSGRAKKLKGRDFTSSVVLEILELAGEVPHELFEKIDKTRQVRNRWLHSLGDVTGADAAWAVLSTQALMKHATGMEISICLSRIGAMFSVPKSFFTPEYAVNHEVLRAVRRTTIQRR